MANSSMDFVSSFSSISAPDSRRYYPSPANSCNASFSFTASTCHADVRAPPTSPIHSDLEHSWKEEISWQIELNERLNYPKTLGSALSPWRWSSPSPSSLSPTFRRTPNDHHLPRTHENGKFELRSYAASESEMGYYSESDDEEKEEVSGRRRVGLMGLFRYSTKWDMVVVMVGCVGAIINGGSLPCYSYLFGELVTKIASEALAGNKTQMLRDVQQVTHHRQF
ncbi:hypothetical protein K1719_023313 [Acacia pycnantha]|nr:hypothetical protein K1719_023313 [Acacia pycnantha]